MENILKMITNTLRVHPSITPLESSSNSIQALLHFNVDGRGYSILIQENESYDGEYKKSPAERKVFYLTLTRELIGYCIKVYAESEIAVRLYAQENHEHHWCSVFEKLPSGATVIGYPVDATPYDRIVKDQIKIE